MISHDHTPPSHHVCGFACCCLGLGLSWRSRCSAHCVCRSRFFRRSSSFAPQFNASKVPPMPRMGVDSMRVVSACLFSMPVFPNSIIWTQASNKAGGGSYRVLDGTSDICHRDCGGWAAAGMARDCLWVQVRRGRMAWFTMPTFTIHAVLATHALASRRRGPTLDFADAC